MTCVTTTPRAWSPSSVTYAPKTCSTVETNCVNDPLGAQLHSRSSAQIFGMQTTRVAVEFAFATLVHGRHPPGRPRRITGLQRRLGAVFDHLVWRRPAGAYPARSRRRCRSTEHVLDALGCELSHDRASTLDLRPARRRLQHVAAHAARAPVMDAARTPANIWGLRSRRSRHQRFGVGRAAEAAKSASNVLLVDRAFFAFSTERFGSKSVVHSSQSTMLAAVHAAPGRRSASRCCSARRGGLLTGADLRAAVVGRSAEHDARPGPKQRGCACGQDAAARTVFARTHFSDLPPERPIC